MANEDKQAPKAAPAASPAAETEKPKSAELEAQMRGERAKVSVPVAPPRPIRRKPEPLATVDEEKEVAVKVVHSTIIFRPHEKIYNPRLLALAKERGIRLRNVREDS